MKLKEIMRDCLEIRGYDVTEEKLDELYDIYEDCQEWNDEEMLTGNSYVEVEDFVKHSRMVDEVFTQQADLVLDSEELLDFDMRTGNIKVDKDIFDDFVPNTYVNIQFVDDKREDRIAQYKMISEDDEGICMEYIGEAN